MRNTRLWWTWGRKLFVPAFCAVGVGLRRRRVAGAGGKVACDSSVTLGGRAGHDYVKERKNEEEENSVRFKM